MPADAAVVIERVNTPRGEFVLRRRGAHHEVISNGVFLMDDEDVRSEERLVAEALARCRAPRRVVIGGLGVGASLHECLHDPRVESVTVLEIEQTVTEWYDAFFAGSWAGDDRVSIMCADAVRWFGPERGRYDAICMDIDNGPDWQVYPSNAALYSYRGLRQIRQSLAPGGVAAFWSSAPSPSFRRRLGDVFRDIDVVGVPSRATDDVIYLATT